MFIQSKPLIIDAKGHLMGRLAAIVAKTLLNGQRVVIVRCEQICISGSLYRNKLKYHEFLRKRTNTNPRRGPFHFRQPSKIFWRTTRGMMPHKSHRGAEALGRLKCFEGVPPPYDKKKRFVVPATMRTVRMHPRRKWCSLGLLSHEVGWKYKEVLETLEAKRRVKAKRWYAEKKRDTKLTIQAKKNLGKKLESYNHAIAALGGK